MMLGSPTNYTLPVFASVLLHSLLIAWIAVGWMPEEKPRVITPRYIDAKLLQMTPTVVQPAPKAQPSPPPKPKPDYAEQRAEQQRQEKVKKEQARQQQLKVEAERKRKAEQVRKAEQAKKDELARQEALKKQQQEKARQEALRKQRESELANALANEAQAIEAQEDEVRVGSYIGYIQDRIGANWSRPPSARRGMQVELELQLDGRARVISVVVVKSSGNPAFDRSAEQAVRQAEHFERLLESGDRTLFDRNFRRFRLLFNPEDLRM